MLSFGSKSMTCHRALCQKQWHDDLDLSWGIFFVYDTRVPSLGMKQYMRLKIVFRWDITLRAPTRKGPMGVSCWLRKSDRTMSQSLDKEKEPILCNFGDFLGNLYPNIINQVPLMKGYCWESMALLRRDLGLVVFSHLLLGLWRYDHMMKLDLSKQKTGRKDNGRWEAHPKFYFQEKPQCQTTMKRHQLDLRTRRKSFKNKDHASIGLLMVIRTLPFFIRWVQRGNNISEEDEIMRLAICYFRNLFTTSKAGDASKIYGIVKKRISNELNDNIMHPFREEEIWVAVKDMAPLKAPGIDGFLTLFYKKYWHIFGMDVVLYCLVVLKDISYPLWKSDVQMQLLDDDDLGIMMEIWWSNGSENPQPVELFAELADLELVENEVEDFSDPDVDEVPDNIDDKGLEEVKDVHGPSFSNPSHGIILQNEPGCDMLNVDPDAARAFEFLEYAGIVPAHKLASNSQLEELFIGQRFENNTDCMVSIKQYNMNFSIDYKVAKSISTLYVEEC
ncbi:hypothetical protein GOBAR_DD33842 [Gossypium barbadense]|nr:hypothetical protein GOBAR_DD33842 [Gossypium barbadense]